MRYLLLLFVCLVPQLALSAVTISEVAWMGTSVSANHEWIELFNDGAAVDLTGWTLSDGNNLTIELAGTIEAGTRVRLERTSDESAPGTAFLIYTGALVNSGATLELRRTDGSLVDRIVGGENWEELGGDNATKETAQYTASGWITAAPTPGAPPPANPQSANTTETEPSAANQTTDKTETESEPDEAETGQAPKRDSRNGSESSVTLELPDNELALAVAAPTTMYVNQAREFSVSPSGVGDTFADSLRYRWNFGDGSTTSSQTVTHEYAYPGSYVVTVHGKYKRQERVVRHDVTVLPVRFSLDVDQDGDIQIHNHARYDVDLSGFRLVGERAFTFDPYTIVKERQTITIPHTWITAAGDRMLALYDRRGELVASRLPERLAAAPALAAAPQADSPTPPPAATAPAPQPYAGFGFVEEAQAENEVATTSATPLAKQAPASSSIVAAAASGWGPRSQELWLLIAVLGSAMVGIYLTAHRPKPDPNPFTRPD